MWRYLWLTPLYLLLGSLPFLSQVGRNLEYEYALATSFFCIALIPLCPLLFPAKFLPRSGGIYRPPVAFEVFWLAVIGPLILSLPAVYAFSLDLCDCSYNGFIFWFALQIFPSWLVAHGLHHATMRLIHEGKPKLHILYGYIALYTLSLATTAALLWVAPQKRTTDLLLGVIHGPIYDEWIPVDGGIVLARLAHAVIGCLLLAAAWMRYKRIHIASASCIGLIWLLLAFSASSYPSIGSGIEKLNTLLPKTLRSGDVSLHYKSKQDGPPPTKIKRLFADARFHVNEIAHQLGVPSPRVGIYVYPDRSAKKLWFGGGATDVADVRNATIHITANGWPHPTLRHELVHAIAADFGFYGLGFHPNMAFTEGLAVALAPKERELTLDQGAANLFHSKRMPHLDNLFSPFFWRESGRRAYTVAGSIIQFVIEKHGIQAVKELYSGSSWEKSTDTTQREILIAWKKKVMSAFDPKDSMAAEALFRHPGILRDRCPHTKADYRQPRQSGPFTRLRQPVGWDPKEDYWLWRLDLNEEDRSSRLSLWRKEISEIARERVVPVGKLVTWRSALSSARNRPPKTLEDIDMAILEADVAAIIEEPEVSLSILQELKEYQDGFRLSPSTVRRIEARLGIQEAQTPEESVRWIKFLAGWRSRLPSGIAGSEPWILTYLRVRNGDKRILLDETLTAFLATSPPEKYSPTFHIEWFKYLGHRLLHLQLYDKAETAYTIAKQKASPSIREVLDMHIRRARFYRTLPEEDRP